MTIHLTLDVPARPLWPNARPHWAVKARATKAARKAAWTFALKALREARLEPPMWERATTRVVFLFPDRRKRDKDNAAAALKAYWDGIADAGVVANDAGLTHEPVAMLVDRKRPRVELTITPLDT